jgi:hypothetical protein
MLQGAKLRMALDEIMAIHAIETIDREIDVAEMMV